ncbi:MULTISPECIES: c-type cytochrome [Pseudomonas]|uniref:c-type cytochrome n=1 Tax=Pseudomonas TaxID=286 RepID=UPI000BA35BCF|nr:MULTISPECIES: c-type cytochrome [Pseudomonas]MDR9862714.1 c-type cytochrome [Pseudomonas baetica]
MRLSLVFTITSFLLATNIALAGDDLVGVMAANGCVNCHGVEGRGSAVGNIPPLSGRSKDFLVFTLNGYKTGSLQGTVMNRIMKDIDDKQIDRLANYFTSFK